MRETEGMAARALIQFEERCSESELVKRVWRCHSERPGEFQSMAACNFEMVVSNVAGRRSLTLRGPETRWSSAWCPPDGEWLAIRFRLGTFLPNALPRQLRDRQDQTLPQATSRKFWLDGEAWEYPSYENADVFVQRLVKAGSLRMDPIIGASIRGESIRIAERTVERHWIAYAGIRKGLARQIGTARDAVRLLRSGVAPIEVAHTSGYFDQAHLSRAIRRFTGETPGSIARGERQLSFLEGPE